MIGIDCEGESQETSGWLPTQLDDRIHANKYVCMYVCMYTNIHTHTYKHTLKLVYLHNNNKKTDINSTFRMYRDDNTSGDDLIWRNICQR